MHSIWQKVFRSRLVWALCLGTSIATSKYLLTEDLKDYPLRLLCFHLCATQLEQMYHWMRDNRRHGIRQLLHDLRPNDADDILAWILVVLAIPLLLVMTYKYLAFSNNLASTVLVLTLSLQPSLLLERILQRKIGFDDLLRYLIFGTGLLLIYICDFRFRNLLSLAFLGSLALTDVCSQWKIKRRKAGVSLRPRNLADQPMNWIPFALIAAIVLMFCAEEVRPTQSYIRILPTAVAIFVNTLATSFALKAEIPGRQSLRQDDLDSGFEDNPTTRAVFGLAVAGVASALGVSIISQPPVMSLWQYVGYGAALFAFATTEEMKAILQPKFEYMSKIKDLWSDRSIPSLDGIGLPILVALSWAGFLYGMSNFTPPLPSNIARLDLSFTPRTNAQLDIVVARYSETPDTVAQDLQQLLSLDRFQELEIRVFLYNKGDNTEDLKSYMVAAMPDSVDISVESLDNVGQEGDTYLNHIINNWDDLATYTLFMQAEMHDLWLARNFIQTFFVPETGFLHLSYEGNVCKSCDHDATCWSDDPAVWKELYALANPSKQCQSLVLTFRGQFIVSAARIRGNEKRIYKELLQGLRDPASRSNSPEYMGNGWHGDQVDLLSAPVIGFTLERMFGVLMQCSELWVGYYCPSQLAAYLRPQWLAGRYNLEDAQCLDRPMQS